MPLHLWHLPRLILSSFSPVFSPAFFLLFPLLLLFDSPPALTRRSPHKPNILLLLLHPASPHSACPRNHRLPPPKSNKRQCSFPRAGGHRSTSGLRILPRSAGSSHSPPWTWTVLDLAQEASALLFVNIVLYPLLQSPSLQVTPFVFLARLRQHPLLLSTLISSSNPSLHFRSHSSSSVILTLVTPLV
ncbi:hypothetical protein B0T10DRAFT_184260 [Thelonectria olida]|uniref:Uncharacterized protein n=1 Tax=Thelonectria olida TaxID=1576542 RepID=A0A9P8WE82_9HYPO|nr:hypothetical protein B0T10DRAFT_184260 [Thelonectria olida]